MHIAKWSVLLSIFWLLLSGFIQPLLLSFGLVSVLIVVYVLKRMDSVDREIRQLGAGHQMIRYLIWLLGQIVSSSIHVTKLVWGSSSEVSPAIARISARNIKQDERVLYANSITLTPGTLCVDLKDGYVTVHALQEDSIEEIKQGDMERKITGIWGGNK